MIFYNRLFFNRFFYVIYANAGCFSTGILMPILQNKSYISTPIKISKQYFSPLNQIVYAQTSLAKTSDQFHAESHSANGTNTNPGSEIL